MEMLVPGMTCAEEQRCASGVTFTQTLMSHMTTGTFMNS